MRKLECCKRLCGARFFPLFFSLAVAFCSRAQRMGIPGFTKALLALFPKAVIPIPQDATEYFDHIYLDLNGLIHVIARKAKSEEDLIRKMFRRLDKFFKTVVPVKSVFLALGKISVFM